MNPIKLEIIVMSIKLSSSKNNETKALESILIF
jgi:hypothetical protein